MSDQVTSEAAHYLGELSKLMASGRVKVESWNVEHEAEPVGHSRGAEALHPTGRASLSLTMMDSETAAEFRAAVAAAKPAEGVAIPPALFERLRLMADIQLPPSSAGGRPVHFCNLCHSAPVPLGEPIAHAKICPGPELERLAELERLG